MVGGSLNHVTSWGVLLSGAITAPAIVTWLEVPFLGIICLPWNSGEHLVPWKVTTHCSQLSTGLWEVFVQVCLCVTSPGSFLFTDGETEAKVPNLVQAEVFTCQTYWNLELSNLLGTTLWPTGHSGACQRFFKVSTSCYTSPGEWGQTFPPSVSYWYGTNSCVLHWFLRWAAVSLISFLHHLLGSLK